MMVYQWYVLPGVEHPLNPAWVLPAKPQGRRRVPFPRWRSGRLSIKLKVEGASRRSVRWCGAGCGQKDRARVCPRRRNHHRRLSLKQQYSSIFISFHYLSSRCLHYGVSAALTPAAKVVSKRWTEKTRSPQVAQTSSNSRSQYFRKPRPKTKATNIPKKLLMKIIELLTNMRRRTAREN